MQGIEEFCVSEPKYFRLLETSVCKVSNVLSFSKLASRRLFLFPAAFNF